MVYKIKEGLYFDNEKLNIIKGEYNKYLYMLRYNSFPDISRKSRRSIYPTIVFLSATICNLKCKYCFAHSGTYGNNTMKELFLFDDYVEIFESALKQFGGINAISFFGGEPLLNFDEIKKFVVYMHQKYDNKKIPFMAIASNGIIMNQEIKNFLIKYDIGFCTSLDGPKELNDLNRVGPNIKSVYDKVVDTMNSLADATIRKSIQFTFNKEHLINYKKEDIIIWIKEFENLNIEGYEVVAVTSDDENCKIDLENPIIFNNYIQLCNDISNYCLQAIRSGNLVPMPKIFASLLLHIIKKVYQEDCSAGFSFSVSPDKIAFPCHVCADDMEYGIEFTDFFREEVENNEKYQMVDKITRENIEECKSCIAKNVCSYNCKGLTCRNSYKIPKERCVMMQIFTERVIVFLADEYAENKDEIKKILIEISKGKNYAKTSR